MTAVYEKELKSYFNGMIGFVFITFILLTVGIYTVGICLLGQSAYFENIIYGSKFILVAGVPLLTMGVMANERRHKTDQLLFTTPVSITGVVLGKYFAMLTVFLVPVLIMSLYPLILAQYGNLSLASAFTSIAGLLFLGAALIALGMFISTVTESQIIAAVATVASIMFIYFIGTLSSIMSSTTAISIIAFSIVVVVVSLIVYFMTKNKFFSIAFALVLEAVLLLLNRINSAMFEGAFIKMLSAIAMFDKLDGFVSEVFDIGAIVYFVSIAALFLFFCVQAIEKRRWS